MFDERIRECVFPILAWRGIGAGQALVDPLEQGSAFFVTPSGVFVTAKHVFRDRAGRLNEPMAIVYWNDRREIFFEARVVGVAEHPDFDIAIGVAILPVRRPRPMALATRPLEPGAPVLACGFPDTRLENDPTQAPEGLKIHFADAGDIHPGTVSELQDRGRRGSVYVHSARANQGISGGPLVGANDGVVYGINSIGMTSEEAPTYSIACDVRQILDWHLDFLPCGTLRETARLRPELITLAT